MRIVVRKKVISLTVVLLTIAFTLYVVGETSALSTGIFGFSGMSGTTCTACHSGGVAPTVVLDGPAIVEPGQTATYMLQITSGDPVQQTAAGLDVAVTDGILASLGGDTQVMNGEITHTEPKANNGAGVAAFAFSWTAPATLGEVTMFAAGNSVNQNALNTGDLPDTDAFTIQVASATDVSLTGLTGAPDTPTWLGLGVVLFAGVFIMFLRRRLGFRRNER